MSDTTPHVAPTPASGSHFDWPAILGGAAVAAAIAVLFTGFGAALGLTTISAEPGTDAGALPLVVIGAWLLISTIASYTAGGYIAGRMRRRVVAATEDEVTTRDAMHGAVVWALGILLSGWLAAGVVGNVASTIISAAEQSANALGGAVETVPSSAPDMRDALDEVTGNPLELVNARLLRGTGLEIDETPELPDGGMAVLRDVVRTGEIDGDDRAYLAETIATNSNLSQQEAEARVDDAVAQVVAVRDRLQRDAEMLAQQARDAADAARRSAVLTGFATTAALLLAAAGAIWGAAIGGRHREQCRVFGGFRSF